MPPTPSGLLSSPKEKTLQIPGDLQGLLTQSYISRSALKAPRAHYLALYPRPSTQAVMAR
jgi:hypothetical protein